MIDAMPNRGTTDRDDLVDEFEFRDGTAVDDVEVDDWISLRETELGEWEEQSVPLAVSESYQENSNYSMNTW